MRVFVAGASGTIGVPLVRAELSPRTFCIFSREFSSLRQHEIANGQRP